MTVRNIKGVYYVDFRYPDPLTGEPRRFRRSCKRGTSRRQAAALERQWRLEAAEPVAFDPPRQEGFAVFAKLWLDVYVAVNCKPSTYRSREQVVRTHLVPFFGDTNLRAITVLRVQQYKALKKKTLAPKTVNNHLGVLSRLLRSAVEWNYAERNPATGIGFLPTGPQTFRFWDREQSDAFLATTREVEPAFYPVALSALRTGMRQGELLGLEWGDVDFVKRRIHVRRNFTHGTLVTPTNGRQRVVPMSPELAGVLRAHRHMRGDIVFCRTDGTHSSGHCLRRPMARAIRAAGLPRIAFHDLRHSFASQLVMAGVPMKAVQEFLGHTTMQMTMRYSHLSPSARQDYVACLDTGNDAPGPVGRPATTCGPNLGRMPGDRGGVLPLRQGEAR